MCDVGQGKRGTTLQGGQNDIVKKEAKYFVPPLTGCARPPEISIVDENVDKSRMR